MERPSQICLGPLIFHLVRSGPSTKSVYREPLGYYIDGLVQERCNSSALTMDLHLSCTNPSICGPTEGTLSSGKCFLWGWGICSPDLNLTPLAAFLRFLPSAARVRSNCAWNQGVDCKERNGSYRGTMLKTHALTVNIFITYEEISYSCKDCGI